MSRTKLLLLTTALVTAGSVWTTAVQADSSGATEQPRIPLGAMGLSQAGSADEALELPGSDDAAYWRASGNGDGRFYARSGSYRYGSKSRYRRHRPDGNYELRRPRPSDFETEEFKASNAAATAKAQFAYAKGADGGSVIVGVVDEDFDLDHPELEPSIIDLIDVTKNNRFGQSALGNEALQQLFNGLESRLEPFVNAGHGTQVASVIAAPRDGKGFHGIAPDAALVGIRADSYALSAINSLEELEAVAQSGNTFVVAPLAPTTADDLSIIKLQEEDFAEDEDDDDDDDSSENTDDESGGFCEVERRTLMTMASARTTSLKPD